MLAPRSMIETRPRRLTMMNPLPALHHQYTTKSRPIEGDGQCKKEHVAPYPQFQHLKRGYLSSGPKKLTRANPPIFQSRSAALHQLHRALITSPSPLPNTIFSLNFQDQPFGTAWTYSRPADPTFRSKEPDVRNFLMPHFSFWAWPLPFIGSMDRAARAIAAIESGLPFARKIPKAVWRGTTWFNSVQNPRMRQNLIVASRGRPWADIEALEWTTAATGRAGAAGAAGGGNSRNASNALPIEDFCRYKYVVHTEGIAYSGRFQFLQMCASVVITPPILWMQHTTHLVRPVFSSDLAGTGGGASADSRAKAAGAPGTGAGAGWVESERIRNSWPVRYRPEEANIVFVAPDWSDLEATVTWLEDHPDVAEGIARRQREMFVGGGYFSPAAEACYWRALVRGWAEVARTEGMGWEDLEGVTFEAFSLTGGD